MTGYLRHIQSGDLSQPSEESVDDLFANMALTRVFAVGAGVNTFDIRLGRGAATGTIDGWFGEMNALFVPFGSTGTGTLGATSSDQATKK